jgi:hypothetical protein
LFIHTSLPRAPGEVLSILMDVGEAVVQLEGVVVRRCKDGMGVRLDTSCARIL